MKLISNFHGDIFGLLHFLFEFYMTLLIIFKYFQWHLLLLFESFVFRLLWIKFNFQLINNRFWSFILSIIVLLFFNRIWQRIRQRVRYMIRKRTLISLTNFENWIATTFPCALFFGRTFALYFNYWILHFIFLRRFIFSLQDWLSQFWFEFDSL